MEQMSCVENFQKFDGYTKYFQFFCWYFWQIMIQDELLEYLSLEKMFWRDENFCWRRARLDKFSQKISNRPGRLFDTLEY